MQRFIGLLKEDLKNKLGMIVIIWYVLGMFCLLFSPLLENKVSCP